MLHAYPVAEVGAGPFPALGALAVGGLMGPSWIRWSFGGYCMIVRTAWGACGTIGELQVV